MRPRTAQKIVSRVRAGTATHASYNRQTVRQAFKQLKIELTDDLLKPWVDHDEEVALQQAQALANQPTAAARREAKAARIQGRIAQAEARRLRARALQAAKEATEGYKADPNDPLWVGQQPGATVEDLAAAAGREAFKQAIENEIDELPEAITPDTPAVDTEGTPDYASMTRDALRVLAKERGHTGYSSMKKDDLINLLSGL